ncbi:hypothetical protein HY442_02465 [Candidatus Parcubacteria bacterium]|nr:hypothetical protein [Candidatus Parcubacteria bacterium]MBI4385520.1 hypothetical protein [Candidatus Parcubacteria bacterium]
MALNLLPQQEKLALTWERWRRLVVFIMRRLVVGIVVLWGMLVAVEFFLDVESRRLEAILAADRDSLSSSVVQQLESRFQKNVSTAQTIERLTGAIQPATPQLIEVIGLIPPGADVKSIEYLAPARRITIRGRAPTRELVLALSDAIRGNPRYVDVTAPSTNLIKPADIDFSFAFTVQEP